MALLRFTIVLTVAVLGHPVAAEAGYDVMTVFDGNKLGLSVYNLHEDEASVIALDSTRSSISRVSLPLSQSSVVERISGSAEGKPGYHDGPTNEALFNHPRKLTLDSDGNIYVADPKNGAVRMITKTGHVTTIAGGSNRTGHSDGEGSDVTFSNDFEVTYLHSTCTLAVVDRGNRMVREVQLPQFIGRCTSGTAPNSPFTSATLLMFLLAGIAGIVVGVLGTIFTISTPQLQRWQSRLAWAGNTQGSQLGPLMDLGDDNAAPAGGQANHNAAPAGGQANYNAAPAGGQANYNAAPAGGQANQLGDSLLDH